MAPQKKRAETAQGPSDLDLLVKDGEIWNGNGFLKGSILIENGRIARIGRRIENRGVRKVDASGLFALPGLIDAHVHLRDMRLSYKEDFATGTAAAAAGGFTTVLDMPNTLPPTDSPERLIQKQHRASRRVRVNVGFHAAATSVPRTIEKLAGAGAFSLKLYMPRPIAPFDVEDDAELRRLMTRAGQAGIPVTVHAEESGALNLPQQTDSFKRLAETRPPILETRAVERIVEAQRGLRCKVHLCHLTIASSLETVKESSSRITSEATPHHLLLSAKAFGTLGWRAWMVPPLRSESDRRALLAAARSGDLDLLASDHAPHTIAEKERVPNDSPPGIPGLETTLRLMLTLVNKRLFDFSRLISLLSNNPARVFGLASKGSIRPGYDGDVVLVDMKKRSRIDSDAFFTKAKYSPFDGLETRGAPVSTIVGGRLVYDEGELVGKEGWGTVLRSQLSS